MNIPNPLLLLGLAAPFLAVAQNFEVRELSRYVDPWIGVKGAGSNVVGPQVPFGSINPSPDTPNGKTAGYNKDERILGISQTHVSGTGGNGKYGNFLIQPQTGLHTLPENYLSAKGGEEAQCGYYRVEFLDHGTTAEVTAAHHSAIYRFEFPESEKSAIIIDLSHHIPVDSVHGGGSFDYGEITFDPETQTLSGKGAWTGGWDHASYEMYFCARVDLDLSDASVGFWQDSDQIVDQLKVVKRESTSRMGTFLTFPTEEGQSVLLKIAISMESAERARDYLEAEIPDWDFDRVWKQARGQWDRALSTILIDDETADEENLTRFYTALYHTMVVPRDRTDDHHSGIEGPYWDDHYTIWDTFRSLFPLYAIIQPDVLAENVNSFIWRRESLKDRVLSGFIAGKDAGEQGGNNVGVVIADAFARGIAGVNWEDAYSILQYHAEELRVPSYREEDRGWATFVDESSWNSPTVSKTVEYNYNDFSTALMAYHFDRENYERYLHRSMGWEHLWNEDVESDGFTGFLMGRRANGDWELKDPKKNGHWGDLFFYESNSWTYTYYVPHNVPALIAKMGGEETFVERTRHFLNGRLIRWDNEPSFLVPWMFSYVNRPDLSAFYVRKGYSNFQNYYDSGMLGGDEDSGAMSSWYIFAKLGLFPLAGTDLFFLHGPMYRHITLQSESGNRLVIKGPPATSHDEMYVSSLRVNGESFDQTWIRHATLVQGAELDFEMSEAPTDWAREGVRPPAFEEIIESIRHE